MNKKEKRHLAAAVMLFIAFALWLGAVGNADFNGGFSTGDFVRIGVGLALAIAAFPVSGELKQDDTESEDFKDD